MEHRAKKNKLFSFFFLNLSVSFFLILILVFFNKKNPLIYSIDYHVNTYVVIFLLIQYKLTLKMIKDLFKSINDCLTETLLKQPIWTMEKIDLGLRIVNLTHLYTYLCDVSQDISDFYSLPMIATVMQIFVFLLITIYNFVKRFFILNHRLDEFLFFQFIFINLSILSLITFVVQVTNTVKEVTGF